MDGVLIADKPAGLSSRMVVDEVKRLLGAGKAGHAGTLDPLATGVLPVCVGRATLLSGYLARNGKDYIVTALLGVETDTYDTEGNVVRKVEGPLPDRGRLRQALTRFEGKLLQQPPPYSAIKYRGKPLYHYARRGVHVDVAPREVEVRTLELVAPDEGALGALATIRVKSSSGTYVRSIVHDLGQELGCGACVAALRRTACGPFGEDRAVTLKELESMPREERRRILVSMEEATADIPAVRLTTGGVRAASLGSKLKEEWLDGDPGEALHVAEFRILDAGGRLVALYGPRKTDDPPEIVARAVRVIRPAGSAGTQDEAA